MNDNLSEMIGKHRQNEIQDKSLCGVLLVKKRIAKNLFLYFLNLTLCHCCGSKEYVSVTGYNVEKPAETAV